MLRPWSLGADQSGCEHDAGRVRRQAHLLQRIRHSVALVRVYSVRFGSASGRVSLGAYSYGLAAVRALAHADVLRGSCVRRSVYSLARACAHSSVSLRALARTALFG